MRDTVLKMEGYLSTRYSEEVRRLVAADMNQEAFLKRLVMEVLDEPGGSLGWIRPRLETLFPWGWWRWASCAASWRNCARGLYRTLSSPWRTMSCVTASTLRELLRFRMEQRTPLAAQRRRRRGETSPPREPGWGYGRWVGHIERNWYEPGLRLERLKRAVTWAHRDRMSEGHWFDFEAVVSYELRWGLIARWIEQDREVSYRQFWCMTLGPDSVQAASRCSFGGSSVTGSPSL